MHMRMRCACRTFWELRGCSVRTGAHVGPVRSKHATVCSFLRFRNDLQAVCKHFPKLPDASCFRLLSVLVCDFWHCRCHGRGRKDRGVPSFLDCGDGRHPAYRKARATSGVSQAGIVFLCGYGSDMQGSKASWLSDWAQRTGRAFVRFDYGRTRSFEWLVFGWNHWCVASRCSDDSGQALSWPLDSGAESSMKNLENCRTHAGVGALGFPVQREISEAHGFSAPTATHRKRRSAACAHHAASAPCTCVRCACRTFWELRGCSVRTGAHADWYAASMRGVLVLAVPQRLASSLQAFSEAAGCILFSAFVCFSV